MGAGPKEIIIGTQGLAMLEEMKRRLPRMMMVDRINRWLAAVDWCAVAAEVQQKKGQN